MPRLEVCSEDQEPTREEFEALTDKEDYRVPAEHKASSWGWLDGRLVAIDYGS